MQNFIEEVIPKNLKIENTINKFFIELEQIVFYFISLFIKTVFFKPNIAKWALKPLLTRDIFFEASSTMIIISPMFWMPASSLAVKLSKVWLRVTGGFVKLNIRHLLMIEEAF